MATGADKLTTTKGRKARAAVAATPPNQNATPDGVVGGAGESAPAPAGPAVLTGRKTGKTPGGMFLPYQLNWIRDESPAKLGNKSRRTGFTYCESYDAVSRRFRRTGRVERDYWFSSADESAAAEFIEYCAFFARDLFGAVADKVIQQVADESTGKVATAFTIRVPNGPKIVAMSSNPRRFRSKGGDVGLDEFAFHDDPRAMYTAASPCTTWGGTLRVFSTHNGEANLFNKFVKASKKLLAAMGFDPEGGWAGNVKWDALTKAARACGVSPVLSYHAVTIEDAIRQGIVEKINERAGTVWTRESFLADCRSKCIDEESFLQEYMCVPGVDSEAWLPFTLIETCEDTGCPAVDGVLTGYTGGPCLVGVDVARRKDLTVIWVLERVGDVLWTRQVRRLAKMELPDQQAELESVLRNVRVETCEIDMTGIGLGLYEYTRRKVGGSIHGVDFASSVDAAWSDATNKVRVPVKQSMALAIKEAFQDRRVRIPADDGSLRDALHKVRKTTTATGKVVFNAERDDAGHADEFWALALAIAGGKTGRGGGFAFVD